MFLVAQALTASN